MLKKKDVKILKRLRSDARENLTKMSRATSIPVSTLYDRLKKYLGSFIKKPTILLNYDEIGYDIRVNLLVKVGSGEKEKFEAFLTEHGNVNNVLRVNNGFDFMVEALFQSIPDFKKFTDRLSAFSIKTMEEYFVLEDVKREGFMTDALRAKAST